MVKLYSAGLHPFASDNHGETCWRRGSHSCTEQSHALTWTRRVPRGVRGSARSSPSVHELSRTPAKVVHTERTECCIRDAHRSWPTLVVSLADHKLGCT